MTCRVGVVRWGLSPIFIPWTGSRKLISGWKDDAPPASRKYLDSCLHLFTRNTECTWSQLRSGVPHWPPIIAVEIRRATLNSHDRGWGPARRTGLPWSRLRSGAPHDRGWGPARHTGHTWSRLRSGTQHWTHMIAVEVWRATLNSHDRGWGPARHTELTWSRLRSGTPHWTHMIAVEVRHATLNSHDRGGGPARHTALTWSQEEDDEEAEDEEE